MSTAAQFHPQIWHIPGVTIPILVCGSRFCHGDEIKSNKIAPPAAHQKNYTFIAHHVAIQIAPILIITGFMDRDPGRVWTCDLPEEHGISRRAAELALAEAWRCIKVKGFDLTSRDIDIKVDESKLYSFRNGTIHRNIQIWLHWDKWNRAGLHKGQRIEIVTKAGFECTPKAFQKVLDDAGMSIP